MLLLAGCGSKEGPSDGEQVTPPDRGSIDNGEPNGTIPGGNVTIPDKSLPRRMELNNCTYQASAFTWPTEAAPGDFPPGWDPAIPIATDFLISFFECGRMAWGPYERPMVFAIEEHTKLTAPEACQAAGTYDVDHILQRFWTNDTEVAAYLEAAYDMPVGIAEIGYETIEQGEARLRTWTITPEDAAASILTYPEQLGPDAPSTFISRFAWWNETMLGFLDLTETSIYSYPGATLSQAHLEPPLLAGTLPTKDNIGGSSWGNDLDATGDILLWKDYGCTEPY